MKGGETVRTFLAIDAPEGLKDAIADLQQNLRERIDDKVSWTRAEGIHLTLKFLGDVPGGRIGELRQAVEEITSNHNKYRISSTATGGFPSLKRPQVLWLGVDGGGELIELQREIERAVETLGLGKVSDKRFHPHLTVGRVKALLKGSNLPHFYADYEIERDEWTAGAVNIMKSDLMPGGAVYTVQASCPFI